jgi:prepilin-type N-terminal cleavage/methylation domain-containing protein
MGTGFIHSGKKVGMSGPRTVTQRPSRSDAGFTLVELMIVILVILVLAAILLPQLGIARERARKAMCVSNQRNIETAVAMWAQDNTATIFTGGLMTVSIPNAGNGANGLTGSTSYTTTANFAEPEVPAVTDGSTYYLSAGSTPAPTDLSYGHVACAADKTPDPWVAGLDGTAGTINNISHTRGVAASP